MNVAAVLMDLDGTLVDSVPDIADAVHGMRADLGLPPITEADVARCIGKGMEVLVRRVLALDAPASPPDDEAVAHALARLQHHYAVCNGRRSRLYPGVLEGLQAFRDAGARLAVVTNKPEAFTHPLLAQLGLAHWFEVVVGGDTCARRKPSPDPLWHACTLLGVAPDTALFIGDSLNDAQAARAAGMPVVILPYGYNEGEDVRTLDADAIVPSIDAAARWAAQH